MSEAKEKHAWVLGCHGVFYQYAAHGFVCELFPTDDHAKFGLGLIEFVGFDGLGGKKGVLLMMIAILAVIVVDYLKYRGVPVAQRIS